MNASVLVDEGRQLVDVCRLEFRARAIFENEWDYRMFAYELRERLFVGRELSARRLLAAGEAELPEEKRAKLLGAVGIETWVGVGENLLRE